MIFYKMTDKSSGIDSKEIRPFVIVRSVLGITRNSYFTKQFDVNYKLFNSCDLCAHTIMKTGCAVLHDISSILL